MNKLTLLLLFASTKAKPLTVQKQLAQLRAHATQDEPGGDTPIIEGEGIDDDAFGDDQGNAETTEAPAGDNDEGTEEPAAEANTEEGGQEEQANTEGADVEEQADLEGADEEEKEAITELGDIDEGSQMKPKEKMKLLNDLIKCTSSDSDKLGKIFGKYFNKSCSSSSGSNK